MNYSKEDHENHLNQMFVKNYPHDMLIDHLRYFTANPHKAKKASMDTILEAIHKKKVGTFIRQHDPRHFLSSFNLERMLREKTTKQ